ncbi:MAG: ATP-dependent helicase, partial [Rhodoglobus sp.]|nr:ATP-dependent helicase [Rhodoglobus sp.]
LSRALAENVADPDEVREFARRYAATVDLPSGGKGAYAQIDGWAVSVGALDVLVDLAADSSAAKVRRGLVEYSDQVALALEILRRQPRVAQVERDRFRVVLLDEYQDTSVVQARLLAELFAGHPVMAVGDPNQSIYGWRGASASNLDDFATAFGATEGRFALSTSWRNGRQILDTANSIVAEFVASSKVQVERLEPSDSATNLPVDIEFRESVVDEADAAALWLKSHLAVSGEPPSAAMLFRTRKTQGFFLEAMRRHDVKFHVLGIGGLLSEPEIADLVCALTVVHDPSAGLELVRLLAGSRWRIGVQDLWALSRLASWLRDRDYAQQRYEEELGQKLRSSVAEGEGGSIVDAVDFIAGAKPGHSALADFSVEGLERLRDAGRLIARLRSRGG